MTAFLQKHATLFMVLLAIPALLIILGMTESWAPATRFTRALGLPATRLNGSAANPDLGPAPEWALKDLEGKTVSSKDFQGKVLLVNFWATWCPPCVAEIPDFIKVQEEYRAQGLTIAGISVDEGGADLVRAFAKKHGINYPVLLADSAVAKAFGEINGIPASFLIDQKGRIRLHHTGNLSAAKLRSALEPLLAAP